MNLPAVVQASRYLALSQPATSNQCPRNPDISLVFLTSRSTFNRSFQLFLQDNYMNLQVLLGKLVKSALITRTRTIVIPPTYINFSSIYRHQNNELSQGFPYTARIALGRTRNIPVNK
jgi:hypothetical protein